MLEAGVSNAMNGVNNELSVSSLTRTAAITAGINKVNTEQDVADAMRHLSKESAMLRRRIS